MKPGYKTTEFWLTLIINIAMAVLSILSFRGLMSKEESDLWLQLVQAVAAAVAPVVMAIVTAVYTNGRSKVKSQ